VCQERVEKKGTGDRSGKGEKEVGTGETEKDGVSLSKRVKQEEKEGRKNKGDKQTKRTSKERKNTTRVCPNRINRDRTSHPQDQTRKGSHRKVHLWSRGGGVWGLWAVPIRSKEKGSKASQKKKNTHATGIEKKTTVRPSGKVGKRQKRGKEESRARKKKEGEGGQKKACEVIGPLEKTGQKTNGKITNAWTEGNYDWWLKKRPKKGQVKNAVTEKGGGSRNTTNPTYG